MIVPIFDHGSTIRGVVESLAHLELPCLIVDDGSGAHTRAEIDRLALGVPWVEVVRRRHNGGRGAAIKTGYRAAAERGYSHALQVDADGQHDTGDATRFLARGARSPEAMVLGDPIFDESVPRSRLVGRQFSRFFVWLFTLSGAIRDPLCGFRMLPLGPVLEVIDRVGTGDHMEFDPELAVRLYWLGVPVETVRTRVIYPIGGISHFHFGSDGLRMARVYVRFLFLMIPRVPGLLMRRARRSEAP